MPSDKLQSDKECVSIIYSSADKNSNLNVHANGSADWVSEVIWSQKITYSESWDIVWINTRKRLLWAWKVLYYLYVNITVNCCYMCFEQLCSCFQQNSKMWTERSIILPLHFFIRSGIFHKFVNILKLSEVCRKIKCWGDRVEQYIA